MKRLNIGCGPFYKNGWTNVDAYDGVKADVYASIFNLPFGDNTVDAIFCGHVLEHVRMQDVVGALQECKRVLKPGAMICAVGPDVTRLAGFTKDQCDAQIYGTRTHDLDIHWWGSCEVLVKYFMRDAGFTDVVGVHPRDARLDEWEVQKGPMTDCECAVLGVKGGLVQST